MIAELYFSSEGRVEPVYLLDCVGNLLKRCETGQADALIPFAVELVSSASELRNPYPWTITVEDVLSRIQFVAEAVPDIFRAYPNAVLSQAKYPFIPPLPLDAPSSLVEQAIDLFPDLLAEEAQLCREKLGGNGVFQIPLCLSFNSNLHEPLGGGICVPPLEYVSCGWMSSTRVYRKAVVRSA